jgi:hypothetical protein
MKVTELAPTTPYSDVVALAVSTIINQDFEFKTSPLGDLEGLYIFDNPDSATLIEMDSIMFIEVYNKLIAAGGLTPEILTLINSMANLLDSAA